MSDRPEPDRLEDFPHPRETLDLYGHEDDEQTVLEALRSGMMPHAWLITGPQGVGKATLAYRIARFILAHGDKVPASATSLQLPPSEPVVHRVSAEGHGDLLVLRRPWDDKGKKHKRDVTVDEIRRMHPFFGMAAGEGGWRIAIVDSADDMNPSAANALLKTLEEPPSRSLILVIASSPGKLLPTIRSRCRNLSLKPLTSDQVATAIAHHLEGSDGPPLSEQDRLAIAGLAEGSVGHALSLASGNGLDLYRTLMRLFAGMPSPDPRDLHVFAASVAGKNGEKNWRLFGALLLSFLAHLVHNQSANTVRAAVLNDEQQALDRLMSLAAPVDWIDTWESSRDLMARCDAVNLDRKQVTLSIFFSIQELAAKAA